MSHQGSPVKYRRAMEAIGFSSDLQGFMYIQIFSKKNKAVDNKY